MDTKKEKISVKITYFWNISTRVSLRVYDGNTSKWSFEARVTIHSGFFSSWNCQ